MFKVTAHCHDNKLHQVIWALVGLTVDKPVVDALREEAEAKEPNGGAPAPVKGTHGGAHRTSGPTLYERAYAWLLKHPPKGEFTARAVVQAIEAVGGKANAVSYVIAKLRQLKQLTGPSLDKTYVLNTGAGGKQETVTKGRGGGPLNAQGAFAQRVAKATPRLPLVDVLPGKVMQRLIDKGVTTVNIESIGEAAVAVGGSKSSAYYVTLFLAKRGLITQGEKPDTYELQPDVFKQQIGEG